MSYYDWTYMYILLAVIAIILLGFLLFRFLKKRRKQQQEVSALPRPAHELALEALRILRDKDYLRTGRFREYYFELSDILRHYIEERFQLRAPEMTTEEFLSILQNTNVLNFSQKTLLREFLSHCDMVKFAKYLPEEKEHETSYESARSFIEETKADLLKENPSEKKH